MIIDSHLYCFPPADSPSGYEAAEDKLRIIQRELGPHHQPVWRVRDREPADNDTLVDPKTGELRDVRWTRHQGRLAWEYEGELYTKQYFPPMLNNLESTPELIVGEMDYVGVEMGILHTYPNMGTPPFLNEFLRDAVDRFSDRLMRLISVAEGDIPASPDAAISAVEAEVAHGDKLGLQFIPGLYYRAGHEEPWDDGALRPFWQAVASTRVPVFFTLLGGRPDAFSRDWREEYIEEQRVLTRWMARYPDTTVVITHGLPWRAFMEGDRNRAPRSHLRGVSGPPVPHAATDPYPDGGPVGIPLERGRANRSGARGEDWRRPPHVGYRPAPWLAGTAPIGRRWTSTGPTAISFLRASGQIF